MLPSFQLFEGPEAPLSQAKATIQVLFTPNLLPTHTLEEVKLVCCEEKCVDVHFLREVLFSL